MKNASWVGWKVSATGFSLALLNPLSVKVLEGAFFLYCWMFKYDMDGWYKSTVVWVPLSVKKLKSKALEPEYLCSMIIDACPSDHYEYLDPKVDIERILSDKPEFIKDNDYIDKLYKQIEDDKKIGKERETILLYHLSDLHFQLDYEEGTSNNCGKMAWWNAKGGKSKKPEEAAGKWGDYNWDSNPKTLEQLSYTIQDTNFPDFILWTGDNVDHGQYLRDKDTATTTVFVSDFAKKNCPNAIIFPIHGNHEFVGMGQEDFSMEKNPVVAILSKAWSNWLTPEVKKEYEEKSYFSYEATTHPYSNVEFDRKMNKTRIICLNTESAYGFNFYVTGELNDPGQQFEWLESLLKKMEKDGEIAIIIGHHSPGFNDFVYPWASRLRALYDRYQHIIRLSLFGHTHYEEFHVVRSIVDNKPIGTMHVSPSFTPWQNQNPSIRVITLDAETKLPIKIETRTLDLSKANSDDNFAKFLLDHEFAQEYGIQNLSPSSVSELADRINTDEETAIKYKANMFANGKGAEEVKANGWNEKCRRMTSCRVSSSVARDQRHCMKITDIDSDVLLSYLFDFIDGRWVTKH